MVRASLLAEEGEPRLQPRHHLLRRVQARGPHHLHRGPVRGDHGSSSDAVRSSPRHLAPVGSSPRHLAPVESSPRKGYSRRSDGRGNPGETDWGRRGVYGARIPFGRAAVACLLRAEQSCSEVLFGARSRSGLS
eukprot:1184180-Prorocentrum_minimum.AAC.2